MIDSKPTEFLGEMIVVWDAFYNSNFEKIHSLSKRVSENDREATKLTERVFLHLLLRHPDLILQDNADSISDKIAQAFPQLREITKTNTKSMAQELLKTFYVAN